jgi:Family of unknown function (DUF6364)
MRIVRPRRSRRLAIRLQPCGSGAYNSTGYRRSYCAVAAFDSQDIDNGCHAHDFCTIMRITETGDMGKIAKNLSLEPDAIARGKRYGRRHGKNLSQLVNDFLRGLPLESPPDRELSPLVRRLRGVAKDGGQGRKEYRDHLLRKYGGR